MCIFLHAGIEDNSCCKGSNKREEQKVIYFAAKIGSCTSLGAEYASRASFKSTDCQVIGGKINDIDSEMCDLDWCKTYSFIPGGIYLR